NLGWALLREINQGTPHQAELIKLPSPESTLFELVGSYRRFAELDLSSFDSVISLKYPAWMVEHDRHVLYLQHRLRGLYDSYPPDSARPEAGLDHPALARARALIATRDPDRTLLAPLFDELERLRSRAGSLPPELFRFPGPFAREVVHCLDSIGISR